MDIYVYMMISECFPTNPSARASVLFQVVTNMRGESQEDVAKKLMDADPLLCGLQGPTVGRVFTRAADGSVHDGEFYGATICVPQSRLYESVALLRQVPMAAICF